MVSNHQYNGLTRLWSDTGRSRFFLIADDASLPPGLCLIKTITGKRQHVDPASLSPFEVTQQQAQDWLTGQLDAAAEGFKSAVNNVLSRWKSSPPPSSEDPAETLLRISGQIATSAPEIFSVIRRVFAAAALPPGDRAAAIRAELGSLAETLRANGIPLTFDTEILHQRIEQISSDPVVMERHAEALEHLAGSLEKTSADAVGQLRELAASLRGRAG